MRRVIATIALLSLASCVLDADARPGRDRGRRGGDYVSAALFPDPWTPEKIDGSILWVPTHTVHHMGSEEDGTAAATTTTRVAAGAGNSIGSIQLPHGWVLSAPSSGTRPTTYTTGLSANGALAFASASSQRMVVNNGTSISRHFYETGVGSIAFKLSMATNGATQVILDSASITSTNRGVYVERLSTNRLFLAVGKGEASSLYQYSTSATDWTIAAGWRAVVIVFNAASSYVQWCTLTATGNACDGDWTTETFGVNNAGFGSGVSFGNLTFGTRTTGTSPLNGRIAQPLITSTAISTADRDAWLAYGSALSDTNLLAERTNNACGFNFCWGVYRFDRVTRLYQDSACTSAVTASGQSIGCVVPEDEVSATAPRLLRNLTQGTGANQPTFQTDAADLDGSNDFWAFPTFGARLAHTFIATTRNDDTVLGSRWLSGTATYWVQTGADYASNPGGIAYQVMHLNGGVSNPADLVSETGYNVLEIRKDQESTTARVNGTNKTGPSDTSSANFVPTALGTASDAGWEAEGRIRRLYVILEDIGDAAADRIVANQNVSP